MQLPTKKSFKATGPEDHIIMVYGPPGVGKTTFVNGLAPKVLFLSTDRGTEDLNALRVGCTSWVAFKDTLTALGRLKSPKDQYDIICIDHLDDFFNIAEQHVCDKLGVTALGDLGHGKGWKAYKDLCREFFQRLLDTRLGIVFICHEIVKTKRSPSGLDFEVTQPNLGKVAWDITIPKAGLICYAGMREVKGKDGKRKLIRTLDVNPTPTLYCKDRSRRTKPVDGQYERLDPKRFLETWKGLDNGQTEKARKEDDGKARTGKTAKRGKRDAKHGFRRGKTAPKKA